MNMQLSVYYISEVLSKEKLNYSEPDKISYAPTMEYRKLRNYFQVHHIKVISSQPVKEMFRHLEEFGGIGKCKRAIRLCNRL